MFSWETIKYSRSEKQRLEEIEKQEEENLLGKRNLEQEAISKILESRGLKLYEIPSDGDCMFAAVGKLTNISILPTRLHLALLVSSPAQARRGGVQCGRAEGEDGWPAGGGE